MRQGEVSDQSGTSWFPVITASSCKVAVLVLSIIIPCHEVEGGYRFRCRPSVRHSVRLSRNRFRSITQKLFNISKPNLVYS